MAMMMMRIKRKFLAFAASLLLILWIILMLRQAQNPEQIQKDFAGDFQRLPEAGPLGFFDELFGAAINETTLIDDEEGKPIVEEAAAPKNNLDYNVHVFYYVWYGNPETDGRYYHWNHHVLPHWQKEVQKRYDHMKGSYKPPEQIGSNFYPLLGDYSSRDKATINEHMRMISASRIGVVVLSWYPPGDSDQAGRPVDDLVPWILDIADRYMIKIAFHIEPFDDRTAAKIYTWTKYIVEKYGPHPAFYRVERSGRSLPLMYFYDSYQVSITTWRKLLTTGAKMGIRGTIYDIVAIGLLVDEKHKNDIVQGGFDGFYTYFASDGFSYGSKQEHWEDLKSFADEHELLFVPSVGPGYVDTRIRPWNDLNTKDRGNGRYYERAFGAAVKCATDFISITSFNEWHEGTQIEPAVPKQIGSFSYADYRPENPYFYMNITKNWIDRLMPNDHNQLK